MSIVFTQLYFTNAVVFMFQDLPLKKGDIIVISNKTKVSSVEKNFD